MFTSIAPRYDLLNHVLSMNIDRVWWNRTARVFSEVLQRPDAQVLDLCCGTGDMTFALHRRLNGAPTQIFGADFSHAMLVRAEQKSAGRKIRWVEADALNLPFSSEQFQLVTSAFGFRNLANYDRGLAEIYRVLAPEGEMGILDFGEPKGLDRQIVSSLLSPSTSRHRHAHFWRARSLCISACVRVALSVSGRDVAANARCGFPRSVMDAVHIWDRGPVSGEEVGARD